VSKSKRELSGEEKKLWRRVASGVKARRPLPKIAEEEEVAPRVVKSARETKPTPPAKPVAPARAGAPQNRAGEKRVRRGKLEIGASLDLHGHTQESARAALGRFLAAAQRRGETTVIVVTGKGRAGEGMLKRRFPEWLADRDIRPLISGYAPAHRQHGGGGAFYVFLKRARVSSE
jgi:DNA-nicking Smr family endonuclease